MQRIGELWRGGIVGKLIIIGGVLGVFVVGCCVLLLAIVLLVPSQRVTTGTAPTPQIAVVTAPAVPATRAPTSTEAPEPTATPQSTDMPRATKAPEPTAELEPTQAPTAAPTNTPAPTATSAPVQVQAEPSRGLGMSRAAWEAKAGPSVGKGIIGEKYGNGAEATFLDDVLWRIDYAFSPDSHTTPSDAHDIGKMFIPDDARLIRTYQRDVTTVNLYHSDWLAGRFEADLFNEGKPGDFTLQYNVYEGDVHSLIIALGNAP